MAHITMAMKLPPVSGPALQKLNEIASAPLAEPLERPVVRAPLASDRYDAEPRTDRGSALNGDAARSAQALLDFIATKKATPRQAASPRALAKADLAQPTFIASRRAMGLERDLTQADAGSAIAPLQGALIASGRELQALPKADRDQILKENPRLGLELKGFDFDFA